MFVHAQSSARGVLVGRHTAQGSVRDSILAATEVLAAFYAAPCAYDPRLYLLDVEEGAPLPTIRERDLLSRVGTKSSAHRWVGCVIPSRQGRLAMDLVMLMAPKRSYRRIQAFGSTHAAIAWLLTARPDAHALLASLLRDVDRAAAESRVTARDLRHLGTPAP